MISNASELTPFLNEEKTKVDRYKNEVIRDYWVCRVSREASILARKEVLMGKANFGITGEGKELPQIALVLFFCEAAITNIVMHNTSSHAIAPKKTLFRIKSNLFLIFLSKCATPLLWSMLEIL